MLLVLGSQSNLNSTGMLICIYEASAWRVALARRGGGEEEKRPLVEHITRNVSQARRAPLRAQAAPTLRCIFRTPFNARRASTDGNNALIPVIKSVLEFGLFTYFYFSSMIILNVAPSQLDHVKTKSSNVFASTV